MPRHSSAGPPSRSTAASTCAEPTSRCTITRCFTTSIGLKTTSDARHAAAPAIAPTAASLERWGVSACFAASYAA